MENLSGQVIKGYELREQLGAGGFGAVYLAYQPLVRRDVAVKVILPRYANQPDFIRRFEAEAQLVAHLEHMNIVPLYDYWRDPDGAFLVMRYLRGGSLRSMLKQGPVELEVAARLVDQIAAGLTIAHRHGVVHRDLKPDNILLDEERNGYLADFGIAKDLAHITDFVEEEVEGTMIGSPSYLSPEQVRTEPVTPRTDLYSFGIVLYEILTGDIPFSGLPASSVLIKHLSEPLPHLHDMRPDLPQELHSVIQKATQKNPDERYPDAMTLALAFREALGLTPHKSDDEFPTMRLSSSKGRITERERDTLVGLEDVLEPENPYKGLRAFQEADAADFFGRSALVDLLASRLQEGESGRFLAVVGPSGSGKSSVVKAGLLPAVRAGKLNGSANWFVVEMVPGTHPLEELEAALLRVAVKPPESLMNTLREDERGLVRAVKWALPGDDTTELLLVIDQFEEVFTMVEDESVRTHFLASLLAASSDSRSRIRIVVTMRADFYDRPLLYPDFGNLIKQTTELVLPLAHDELQQAIVGPAERVGLALEPGLVAAIVSDVSAQPGALPLLQYSLSELYERRQGRVLTLEAYQNSGRVLGALARRADELYEGLSEESQQAAQQLFLRLVTLGEGVEDTRRRVRQTELASVNGDDAMQQVIDIFGKYRLLTFDRDPITRGPTIEVAHEALIRQWARLKQWIDTSREDLQMQRRITAATEEWLNSGKDPSFLASGVRLEQFEAWRGQSVLALNPQEEGFLHSSVEEREEKRAQEAARKAHEAMLERRNRNFLRALVAVLAIATLGALGLTGFALNQNDMAQRNAATATVAQGEAIVQADNAATAAVVAEMNAEEARSLALVSGAQLALADNDTELGIALALQANRVGQPSVEAQRTLAESAYAPGTRRLFQGHTNWIESVAYSPDGHTALSGGRDRRLILWDVDTGEEIRQFNGHDNQVLDVAYSPDGQTALSASLDHTLILWNLETGEQIRRFEGHNDGVNSVVFSADGTTALSGSDDDTLILWNVETGEIIQQFVGHNGDVLSVALSATGFTALSGAADNIVILWNVNAGSPLLQMAGHTGAVYSVDYTPDELGALSGSNDHDLILWSFESGQAVRHFIGHSARVTDVDFSPDASLIVSSAEDNTIILWDFVSGGIIQQFAGMDGPVYGVDFSPDGRQIIAGGWDHDMRLLDIVNGAEIRRFTGHTAPVYWVEYSPDGQTAASASEDSSIILWNVQTGEIVRQYEGHTGIVNSVAFSPDGRTMLSGAEDLSMILWDVDTGEEIRRFEGHSLGIMVVKFSPDGQTALSGSKDNTMISWDLETGEQIRRFIGHRWWVSDIVFLPGGHEAISASFDFTMIRWNLDTGEELHSYEGHGDWVRSIVLSPDATTILSASADSTLALWDVETGQRMRTYEGHGTQVQDVALSPDGRYAVSGSNDTTLILWDVQTGAQLRRFIGHEDVIRSVAFSHDGMSVLSGSGDGTVREWQVSLSLEDLIGWASVNRYVREFTCAERERYTIEPVCPTPTPIFEPGTV